MRASRSRTCAAGGRCAPRAACWSSTVAARARRARRRSGRSPIGSGSATSSASPARPASRPRSRCGGSCSTTRTSSSPTCAAAPDVPADHAADARSASATPMRGKAHPIGDELPVAVLFADIRGFTPFSQAVLPYDVIHELQRHLHSVDASRRTPRRRRDELHGRRRDGAVPPGRRSDIESARGAGGLRDARQRRAPAGRAARSATAAPSTSTSASTMGRRSSARCGVPLPR